MSGHRSGKILLVVVLLVLMACGLLPSQDDSAGEVSTLPGFVPTLITPSDTPTATATATYTPTATMTSTPTNTPTYTATLPPTFTPPPLPTRIFTQAPTATASPTIDPNATATFTPLPLTLTPIPPSATATIPPPGAGNRFINPGFEGVVRWVRFIEINVFENWEPFYCHPPYTTQNCPAPRPCPVGQTVGCNDPNLEMRRPEFKGIYKQDQPNRVRSEASAQSWFCYWGTCKAGVYQTVATRPGESCEVGAYIQSWSNNNHDPYSYLETPDSRENSTWQILVDPTGGVYAFDNTLLKSRTFTFNDGIYDKYVLITFTFTAASDRATIFFMDSRLFPITHNDSFIDDAYVICK